VTRSALVPSYAHDPEVETSPRPGFCVILKVADLFLCDDTSSPHGMVMGRGWKFGYCKASDKPRVWTSLAVALDTAAKVQGRVTTVPRRIGSVAKGGVYTWDSVPA
jgi:hypothetical protein